MKLYRFIVNTTNGVNRFGRNFRNDRAARELAQQMIEQNADVRAITVINGRTKVYGITKGPTADQIAQATQDRWNAISAKK